MPSRRRPARPGKSFRYAGSYLDDLAMDAAQLPVGSPQRAAFREFVVAAGEKAQRDLNETLESIPRLVGGWDLLRTLGAIHYLDAIRRSALDGPGNFGSEAMVEYFTAWVASQPHDATMANVGGKFSIEAIWRLDAALREIATNLMTVDRSTAIHRPESRLDSARSLLRLEQHFDRMSGFDIPLRTVATSVFARVDDDAEEEVGFRFSDAIRFADAYIPYRTAQVRHGEDVADVRFPSPHVSDPQEETDQWMMDNLGLRAAMSSPPLELDVNYQIANELGITADSFDRLVRSMATQLGTEPPPDLHSDSALRSRPLLMTSAGQWMWFRPVDFIHGALDWALHVSRTSERLRSRFDKARQLVAEELPEQILGGLFPDRVHRGVTYPAEQSNAEADFVVDLAGAVLLVECKGGRVSAPTRRGAPKRVERDAKEIVQKGADQNARTMRAIADGVPLTTASGAALAIDPGVVKIPLVITLDRVDPFSTHLGQPENGSAAQRSWVVNLADLVMLAEILPTAPEFYSYAAARVHMARVGEPLIISEADALGGWCDDRLASARPLVPGAPRMVSETSESMNAYFTAQALALHGEFDAADWQSPRPSPGIPREVLAALEALLASGSSLWPVRCRQAAEVPPSSWRPLVRVLTKAHVNEAKLNRGERRARQRATTGTTVGPLPIRLRLDSRDSADDGRFLEIKPDPVTVA